MVPCLARDAWYSLDASERRTSLDLQHSSLPSHPTSRQKPGLQTKPGVCIMAASPENTSSNIGKAATPASESSQPSKIDPKATAGSENSLGAQSVRDGRPATDDSTVEAMDEESPDITGTLDTEKGSDKDSGKPAS